MSKEKSIVPDLSFSKNSTWIEFSLPDVVFFQEGPGIMKVDFHEEGIPLVRLAGVGGPVVTLDGCNFLDPEKVESKWSHFRLVPNDLLISTSATFGLSSIVTEAVAGAIFYTGLIRFRPIDDKLDRGYLKVFLESPPFERQVKLAAVGGGIKHFGPTHLKQMTVIFPSLVEQQKIADCLSSLDALIAAHRDKLDALRAHKKGLMQNLFPQEGERVPRYRFEGFVGEWNSTRLEKISQKVMVGIASAATHAYREKGIILLRNQNIKDGYLDDKDLLFIDEEYEKKHKNKRLKAGDLITARTGYPGATCVVPAAYEGAQSFTTLITRPNHDLINALYLCYYINSERGQAFFESNQIGGGQKNVNAGSLSEMPISFPCTQEQKNIADCLSSVDELIAAQTDRIEQLQEHKRGLMQGLFPKVD